MTQRAGYSRASTYTLLFLFKVRLDTYYLLYGATPDKDCKRKPQNCCVTFLMSRSFFAVEKTEESSHITHIVETLRSRKLLGYSQVKEAVSEQPVKEAVSDSQARVAQGGEAVQRSCWGTAGSKKLLGTAWSKKLLGNSRSKKLCETAKAIETFETFKTPKVLPRPHRDVCGHCHVQIHRDN